MIQNSFLLYVVKSKLSLFNYDFVNNLTVIYQFLRFVAVTVNLILTVTFLSCVFAWWNSG